MEKQLSFKLISCSLDKIKNQRRTEKSKLSEEMTKRLKQSDTSKDTLKREKSDALKQVLQKHLEQFTSELLTSSEKRLKLKSLSLEEEIQERLFLETNFLKKTSPEVETPKKDLLFDNSIHLISVKTVAEWLGLAPKTIHNWVSLRKVPYVKCGQKVMFRPKSLKAWLNRKEIKSWL